MNVIDFIKQHLTNKTVVHLSMLAFAVTSTLNIAGFFMSTHHHWLVAASIGLALGGGLMAVSIYLSKQEFGKGLSFWTLLVATVAMALLSGQIQSMGYQKHGLDTFTANLLGFAPPIVAEVLLALSVSLAERTEREWAQRDSKQFIKDSVAESMTSAFRNVDASRIQKHIEKQVDGVIRAFVDDALGEMMAELNAGRTVDVTPGAPTVNTEPAAHVTPAAIAAHVEPLHSAELNTNDTTPAPDIDAARALALDAKRTAKANRQQELLQILMTEFNGQPADALNKTELGQRLGTTRQTVGRDIEELQQAQKLTVNGVVKVSAAG